MLRFAVLATMALACTLAATPAAAQPRDPRTQGGQFYVEALAGAMMADDYDAKANDESGNLPALAEGAKWVFPSKHQMGYAATAAMGYEFDSFRLALEFGYHKADLINQNAPFTNGYSEWPGKSDAYTQMLTGYYDLHLSGWQIVPFIGAGIGVGEVHTSFNDLTTNSTSLRLAYEAMGGFSWPMTDSLSLVAEYRYFGVDSSRQPYNYSFKNYTTPSNDVTLYGHTTTEFHGHEIVGGLRWAFY